MHSLQIGLWVVVVLVALALLFDFMNGFHDAANSIATVVSTGVLKPHQAVAFAAIFNVVALFVFQLKVATTIGIIWMLLIATGYASSADKAPPTWTIVSCYLAIGMGTMFGGWRIVKTMGQKITKLKPIGGFSAECGGAITLYIAYTFGIPVSTTHTITGAIIGVGAAQRMSAVRWGVAGNIVAAWVLTIPAAGLIAAAACWLGGRWF